MGLSTPKRRMHSLATFPPASLPEEENQPVTERGSPDPDETRSSAVGVAPESLGSHDLALDISEPTRPVIIDLVRPEVTPPGMLVDETRFVEPLGEVGLLVARSWQRATKRLIDVVGALTLLALLAPVMLVIAISIPLTSPGPAIYAQRRIGKGGHPFTIYKFRSMDRDAHESRHLHAHRNRHTTGPVFKVPDDPRITRMGRVIRRLSLDELPQLVNVLRGDMSLVGPRPALPEEFALCDEDVRQRTLVRPGLTCIWQVSGRSDVDFLRWVDMDLEYIRTWTLLLDLRLLLRTIPAVFRGQGAY
jgi:lipopolysaccharide/colanic/teichoic acid biosynthesis glycosyltransferase